MLINSILLIILIISSIFIFLIENLYFLLGIFLLSIILSLIFHVKLPIYLPFVIMIIINFLLNIILSNLYDAVIVSIRLITMFILVNTIIKIIGINNVGLIIGKIFHSKNLALIISISLCFIPIMIKEVSDIRKSLYTKNFPLNLKNVLTKGHLFVICFFTNLFKRINEMELILLSKGMEE